MLGTSCATPPIPEKAPGRGPASLDPPSLTELEEVLSSKNEGVNTDAVLILKDGETLYETYRRGYDAQTRHLSWSMAKSIAGILVGQAVEAGRLRYEDPIRKYIPEVKTSATIRDVLQMSSGIAFKEEYSGIPVTSDPVRMLYLNGPAEGFARFAASRPALAGHDPGQYFYYSSGDTNLLMEALKKTAPSEAAYGELPYSGIFSPLGITDAVFEQDTRGTFVGSSYIYLRLADYGKLGTLLANRGQWEGRAVIPAKYFDLMTEVAPGVQKKVAEGSSVTRAYSAQITTNRPIAGRGLASEYGDLPTDALLMIGHQGQLVVASPSQKLVIVRLAMDDGASFDRRKFFSIVSQLVRKTGAKLRTARDESPEAYATAPKPPPAGKKEKTPLREYFRVPNLIRALAAKEYCSCIRVVGRSRKHCKADLKVSLPILPRIEVSPDGNRFTTTLGTGIAGKHSVAAYRGDRLGCVLEESE